MVPHHSTDSAISYLTAQIGRDAVLLTVYGRNSKFSVSGGLKSWLCCGFFPSGLIFSARNLAFQLTIYFNARIKQIPAPVNSQ